MKYIYFEAGDGDQGKVKSELAETYRRLHLVHYGKNVKNGKKVFQHLFQELGGFQIRQWELQGNATTGSGADDDAQLAAPDQGIKFIEERWLTRSIPGRGIEQLHCVTRALHDPKSPLYGQGDFKWTDRLVITAVKRLREDGALAKIVTDCTYTMRFFRLGLWTRSLQRWRRAWVVIQLSWSATLVVARLQ